MRFETFKAASDDPQSKDTVIINIEAIADITYPGKYVQIEMIGGRKLLVDIDPNELKKILSCEEKKEEKKDGKEDKAETHCPFCGAKIVPKDYSFEDGSILRVQTCVSCGRGATYKISPNGEVREVRGK